MLHITSKKITLALSFCVLSLLLAPSIVSAAPDTGSIAASQAEAQRESLAKKAAERQAKKAAEAQKIADEKKAAEAQIPAEPKKEN